VSLEYQVASIDEHLSGGRPWDLDSSRGGFRRMVPQTGSGPPTEDAFAHGNGDLLLRLARDIEAHGAETLVVSSADHVFATDLAPVIVGHRESGLAATLVTAEVTRREAAQNVVVTTGRGGLVTDVDEKPSRPTSGTVATEIFVYSTAPLLATLRELRAELSADAEGDDSGIGDFGEHLLPRLVERRQVRAVPIDGYWRDLGRPGAYLQGHRDLLLGKVQVHQPERPVLSKWPDRPAARVRTGAHLEDSMLATGCDVAGTVVDSVLGPGVVVESGARVVDSVLFDDVVVRRGAEVVTAVVDEGCEIGPRARVGAEPRARVARDEDVTLVGRGSQVRRGVVVPAGARLEPGSTA
jgi:glucose-1-phosphate adenylyltransferase